MHSAAHGEARSHHPGRLPAGPWTPLAANGISRRQSVTIQRTAGERSQPLSAAEFNAAATAIVRNIEKVIEGKTATIRLALAVMLAEGHLLIEDVPGVGKTK